ncbi:MAG: hypothetical protein HY271_06965 [Deltaproteobacteria bacterium]|nr:hypothetical protein [Deltaproteobacteria bacterium]
MSEPYTFEEVDVLSSGRLFRVARPGRATCGANGKVPPSVVAQWIDRISTRLTTALGHSGPFAVDYVCLLGRKPRGQSEIADFYPARGPLDGGDAPTFEAFLNQLGAGRVEFRVHHFPTTDHEGVTQDSADAVIQCLDTLLASGRTVLVGCSAAQGRTMEVLRAFNRGAPPQ